MADVERATFRASLRADQALLCSTQDELSATTQSRAERLRILQDAQAEFDLVDLKHRLLASRCDILRADIAQRQEALSTIRSFPDELLSEIFLRILPPYILSDHAHTHAYGTSESRGADWERIMLPNVLARVSKRWRRVVLRTPDLHSYLAVTANTWSTHPEEFFAYLSRTLERARWLDLFLQATGRPTLGYRRRTGEVDVPQAGRLHDIFWRRVFEYIYANVERLRSLHVKGNVDAHGRRRLLEDPRDLTVGLLRLPTPHLQEVCVDFTGSGEPDAESWAPFPRSPLPVYLPFAPKLGWLRLRNTPVMCAHPAHPGLPLLKSLCIENDYLYLCHLRDMLAVCPSLDELCISNEICASEPLSADDHTPLSLPVRRLEVDHQCGNRLFEGLVDLPRVRELAMASFLRDDFLFDKVKATLTTLELTSAQIEDTSLLEPYAAFAGLERFVAGPGADIFDIEGLVDLMCRADDPMWPRLRALELYYDDRRAGERGGSLVRLAQARKERSAAKDSPIRALETVSLRKDYIAGWAIVQLRALLGNDNVEVV